MFYIVVQLDFKPADIKYSSLRTMAKHVRRAMLSGNHEVDVHAALDDDKVKMSITSF